MFGIEAKNISQEFMDLVLTKYQETPTETWNQVAMRIAMATDMKYLPLIRKKVLMPQGSILYGLGRSDNITVSLSNCVVQSIREDSMEDIMKTGARMAKTYQYRMGVGCDLSILRPRGQKVKNAAKTSSGAASFMEFFSCVTGTVGQEGRRGALMLTIDINHPDVEEFIEAKQKQGAVTNANVSVKIYDDFIEAVKNDDTYDLFWPSHNGKWISEEEYIFAEASRKERLNQLKDKLLRESSLHEAMNSPKDDEDHYTILEEIKKAVQALKVSKYPNGPSKIFKVVRAKELWKKIVNSAYKSAEPGVLFWDRVTERPHGYYPGAYPVTTNPCSEIPLPDDDVCLLTSIYLPEFVKHPYTNNARFDFDYFSKVVGWGVEFLDHVKDIDIEKVPYPEIAEMSRKYRRVGLGTHGLGDTYWRMGLKYGSKEAIEFTNMLYKTLFEMSYSKSIDLAEEKGPFPEFDWEIEKDCNWLMQRLPTHLINRMKKHGRRNIHLNTIAPTGSISVLSHNCSSGIEPAFALSYDRFCLGKILKDIPHGEFEFFKQLTGEEEARPEMLVSNDIGSDARVKTQATATNWLDHSCSSTVNFLYGTSEEDVAAVYMKAFEEGCEGVTVFVSGSREGVVSVQGVKRKRPLALNGLTLKFGEADHNQYITINKNERGEIMEVLVSNLNPEDNLGIDASIAELYKLSIEERIQDTLFEVKDNITIDQKLAVYITLILRCGIPPAKVLACLEDTVAGSLPFYIKVAMKSAIANVTEVFDPNCPSGKCE